MAEHEHHHHSEDKKFKDVSRLRSPERLALMDIPKIVGTALEGLHAQKALDVGTGTGIFAEAFASQGLSVSAVDINALMLEEARKHASTVNFSEAPAESLPFETAEFDVVFLGMVLHEVDDPYKALLEARRVTKQRVAVLEWPYREEEVGPPLHHRLTEEQIRTWAVEANFSAIDIVEINRHVMYRLTF